jgi:hypothetical protein
VGGESPFEMSADQTQQTQVRGSKEKLKVHVDRNVSTCVIGVCSTYAWGRDMPGALLLLFHVTKGSGETDFQGLYRKGEEGNEAVLSSHAGLFPSSCQRSHHVGLGLGKRTR